MGIIDALEVILEEDTGGVLTSIETAMHIVKDLESTKRRVLDLKYQLKSMKNRINAELAMKIRLSMPALNVSIDNQGQCKVGYKSKHLILSPDIERGFWKVKSADYRFSNKFEKLRRRDLFIGADINSLINALTEYFTDYYKSLNEDIVGDGLMLIEGKLSSLKDLVNYKETMRIPLNSRLKRMP